jgi:hypothetical protein
MKVTTRVLKRTHNEWFMTITDRLGEEEIGPAATYSDALQLVVDHAKKSGGELSPIGSDSWNLFQIGITQRINIIQYVVTDD